MALLAIDGATSFAIDDVTGRLHTINLAGDDLGEIDFNVMVSGGVNFKGSYNASTNTPDLDSGTPIAITKGDMYVVSVAGDFFTEAVQTGDALIANIDSALVLADWTRLEGNAQTVFPDNTFRIQDDGDATKEIAFQASGITTGNVRTITMPDQAIDLTPGTGSFATEAEGNLAATALQNIVEDTTPQAGAAIDMNAFDLQFDDNTGIDDDSGNEQVVFSKTATAVNHMQVKNAATGNAPALNAVGDNTDIDLILDGKGSGSVKTLSSDLCITGKLRLSEIIVVSGSESNVIGGTVVGGVQLELTGTVVKTQAFRITSRLQPGVGLNAFTAQLAGTLDIAASGVHPDFAGLLLDAPIITAEAGSVTNATTLKINAAPTGASNNRALWVVAGESLFAGPITATGGGVLTGAWTINGFQANLVELVFAVSDETTALTTGATQFTFRMPFAMTLFAGNAGVRMSLVTTPTGSAFTVDINETGSTILSTKLTIDADEDTSLTAATEVVISDVNLADDAKITIDIDTIGSTIAGAGLKIVLKGVRA